MSYAAPSVDDWGASRTGAWGSNGPQASRTNLLGDEEAPPPTIAVQKEDVNHLSASIPTKSSVTGQSEALEF